MILVDTSVWIDFFAGRDRPHVELLEHSLANGHNLALCGIVLTEHECRLLHHDRDFEPIERVFPLKTLRRASL